MALTDLLSLILGCTVVVGAPVVTGGPVTGGIVTVVDSVVPAVVLMAGPDVVIGGAVV